MRRYQESTSDDGKGNPTPGSSGMGVFLKYRSQKESAKNSPKMTKDYSKVLPDELLVKIFKYTCPHYKSRYITGCGWAPLYNCYDLEIVVRLSQTCKRFCHIINYFVLDDIRFFRFAWIHFEQSPVFYNICQRYFNRFDGSNKSSSKCDYTDEDGCGCRYYRRSLAQSQWKYRYLFLEKVDLSRRCIPKLIQDKLTNLDLVVQLTLKNCVIDPVAIDKILTWLPRVDMLSIRSPSAPEAHLKSYDQEFIHEHPPVRTLSYLHFDYIDRFDRSLADQLLRLPAKNVDGEFWANESDLGFIRQYLLRHKGVVEHFRFRLRAIDDSQVKLKYFEGFSVISSRVGTTSRAYFEINSLPCSQLDFDKMIIKFEEVISRNRRA